MNTLIAVYLAIGGNPLSKIDHLVHNAYMLTIEWKSYRTIKFAKNR